MSDVKTLVVYVDVDGLSDPEFTQLMERIFELPESRSGRLKFNVFDQSHEEVIAHADKLQDGDDLPSTCAKCGSALHFTHQHNDCSTALRAAVAAPLKEGIK